MKLEYLSADLSFRSEVSKFLAENLPADLAAKEASHSHLRRAEYAGWHRTLAARGWVAPNWPREYGGTGWTPLQRHIWAIEYGRACAPEVSVIAIGLVGPVLCRFAAEEQKRRYLKPILDGDLYFCQGFSEPQAGSDLANLRTRAVRDGNEYIITGQKIWTSHASDADFMICLCRTSEKGKPQQGLSMLIVPMDAKGVTVRSIPSIDDSPTVSEVFLDDVRVSADELVGEENMAWTYAKFLLTAERTHNAYIGILRRYQDRLQSLVAHSPVMQRKLGLLEIDIDALEWSVLRALAAIEDDNSAASALKITGSDLLLRAADLELEALQMAALPIVERHETEQGVESSRWSPGKARQMFYWRASSIFGGSNEIQRSIIWNSLASR